MNDVRDKMDCGLETGGQPECKNWKMLAAAMPHK
jgi:hypothetical protein